MVGPELQSTIDLVRRAFPNAMDDATYRGTACVLQPYMSYRALAAVMAELTGRNDAVTYHDAIKADEGSLATNEEIESARARLLAAGLEAWIAEDEP